MFGGFGPWEVILVFLVVLLLFGAKRIPEIAQGLGKGIREFKKATNEISDEMLTDDAQKGEQKSQREKNFKPSGGNT